MGKAGILPDLTSTFSYWRKQYDDALSSGNWSTMSLALHHMNGALEIEYRIPISSDLWEEQKDGYIVWKCNSCTSPETKIINKGEDNEYTKEIQVATCSKREDIERFTEKCSDIIRVLSGDITRRMWICPNCKNIASVRSVESQILKYKQPHYRGCIYEEPSRPKTSLMRNRGSYPSDMRKWGRTYSIELERQLAVYRIEYISQHGHEMEDTTGFQDRGDKS
ncbi:MAG: hypothetical protein HRU07_07275 [Nitrosopumilus sp.]|nr:hypothetical protein [Nitrosopumilus sp.]NRA05939.1 hypothetical protein [Nitrosopumilus sp.]